MREITVGVYQRAHKGVRPVAECENLSGQNDVYAQARVGIMRRDDSALPEDGAACNRQP
jgi:hypothetical protein